MMKILILMFVLTLAACSEDNGQVVERFILAAEQGDVATIDDLLADDVAVNSRDFCQWTPLMKASLNGHEQVVERLLVAGADVNLADKGDYSALLVAASNNHVEVVRMLLQKGSDINQVETTNGWSALIWSAKRGHSATVNLLLAAGADRALVDYKGQSAQAWAQSAGYVELANRISAS